MPVSDPSDPSGRPGVVVIRSPSEPMKAQKAWAQCVRRGAVRKQQGGAGRPVRPARREKVSMPHPGLAGALTHQHGPAGLTHAELAARPAQQPQQS